MNDSELPVEAPPPYSKDPQPNEKRNGISRSARRSMEDEIRPLPEGWVRQFDPQNHHQFFVDTKATPPRSIWHHPYDDEEYLSTLSSEERERIQEEEKRHAKSSATYDVEEESHSAGPSSSDAAAALANTSPEIRQGSGKPSLGRRWKDKLTGTTHEQRVEERRLRDEQEAEAYRVHRLMRQAMARAVETGEPQFVAKDPKGHDVYVEPPQWGGQFYGGTRPVNYRGYNPYSQGTYADPNARFIRPANPYGPRPYGGSYGGGYGGGLGLPLAGGLAGGLLLGGLLGGF